MTLNTVGSSYIHALSGSIYNQAIDNSSIPLLYQEPSASKPSGGITITTNNNTWVDLIFKAVTVPQRSHPVHKHSNRGFIIGQGEGEFNWTSVAEAAAEIAENFNYGSPPLHDGLFTPLLSLNRNSLL